MQQIAVSTKQKPAAIRPYSQGIVVDSTLYISGQLPIDPDTGSFSGSDIVAQTHQCLKNIRVILQSNGMDLSNIVKTTVLLQDISEFGQMNEVYATYFTAPYPARAAFQAAALPKGAKVEIEAVAEK